MTPTRHHGIVCAGNWILDVVHDLTDWPERSSLVTIERQHSGLGGGAANVAGDLVKMGVDYPVVPVGLIGRDAMGDALMRLCDETGLDTTHIGRKDRAATAQSHVMNVPGDSRTFFYHGGANDLFGESGGDLDPPPGRILYLGYLTQLAALDRIGPDGLTRAAHLLRPASDMGMLTCVGTIASAWDAWRPRPASAVRPPPTGWNRCHRRQGGHADPAVKTMEIHTKGRNRRGIQ